MTASHAISERRIQRITLLAATAGWMFAGFNMHLYTIVGTQVVAGLLTTSDTLGTKAITGIVQSGFLLGWAVGAVVFGRAADTLGRKRVFLVTIAVYALGTGTMAVATSWWQLAALRLLTGVGVGGVWSLSTTFLVETGPRATPSWLAANFQTGVSVGMVAACGLAYALSDISIRYLFVFGFLPLVALPWLVWRLPETQVWSLSSKAATVPPALTLFRQPLIRTVIPALLTSALVLTAHWAFMFWFVQQLRELSLSENGSTAAATRTASIGLLLVIAASIPGNYFAGALSSRTGFRKAIVVMLLIYAITLVAIYSTSRTSAELLLLLPLTGLCMGVLALFTTYLPSLYPTLLRSYGVGVTYNSGRLVAAAGTVGFGVFIHFSEYRLALLGTGILFALAAVAACFLPMGGVVGLSEPRTEDDIHQRLPCGDGPLSTVESAQIARQDQRN